MFEDFTEIKKQLDKMMDERHDAGLGMIEYLKEKHLWPENDEYDYRYRKDIRIEAYRNSGPGGQHINNACSGVRLTHVPTGITLDENGERSQHRNKDVGIQKIIELIDNHYCKQIYADIKRTGCVQYCWCYILEELFNVAKEKKVMYLLTDYTADPDYNFIEFYIYNDTWTHTIRFQAKGLTSVKMLNDKEISEAEITHIIPNNIKREKRILYFTELLRIL